MAKNTQHAATGQHCLRYWSNTHDKTMFQESVSIENLLQDLRWNRWPSHLPSPCVHAQVFNVVLVQWHSLHLDVQVDRHLRYLRNLPTVVTKTTASQHGKGVVNVKGA